ncbi:putative ATPase [Streptomyces sp. TLI_235]|nr:LuxR C-terminal-related transcriptional regulator [Streptomyces sp. TLI_235]PBC77057.1 putative ATPase [Streptomyces sp. TLI_235]
MGQPLSRLIARRHDLEVAQRTLSESRLVTFVGVGGVGKTRLALELAYRARNGFPDGVWLVRLTDLNIGAGVAEIESAVVGALGINDQSATQPRDKLLAFLRDRRLLLVLDNCEHVLESVRALVPVMLREAPQLRVVASSREPLGVEGEVLRPLAPLSVPDPATPAEQLLADGSVSLLLERARAVDPDFNVTDDNAAAVVDLCRLLEGVPLAIELAAAKLRALTVEQVVARFGRRLASLAAPDAVSGSRHRSLRAMVDWSHQLCPQTAQLLWRRLSVFPASFDLDLAEAVCAFGDLRPDDVVDSIERLVGQSILLAEREAGTMRYRLLAPVREIAAEHAEQAGEADELRHRHRDVMLRRAQSVLEQWCGPQQEALLERMRLEHADYVAAVQWSLSTPGEEPGALRLMARLRYHWLSGGFLADGRTRMEAALTAVTALSRERAEAMWVMIWIALIQGDHRSAARWLSTLADIAEELDDPGVKLHVTHWGALWALFTGDADTAVQGLRTAVDGHRDDGDRELELTARYMLVTALACAGRAAEAVEISRSTVALCETYRERSARAFSLWAAGLAEWTLDHLDEAERSARAALRGQLSSQGIGVALCTDLLAWVAYDRGEMDRAAALGEAAQRVWRSLGTSIAALGPLVSEFAEGHSAHPSDLPTPEPEEPTVALRSLQDVIDLALGTGESTAVVKRAEVTEPLSKRELEVAALIEVGLSNREIAQGLVIAKRTADGHVERILAKLGFTSRAQVAAWMARRRAQSAGRTGGIG